MKVLPFWLLVLCTAFANFTTDVEVTTSVHYCGSEECSNITVESETTSEDSSSTDSVGSKGENDSYPTTIINVTSVPNHTSTTPLPSTSTGTPILPTIPKNPSVEDPCSCDAVRGICDINCCCDADCSDSDRKAFSHCIPEPESGHSGLCYKQHFLYSNNTRYKVLQQEKGVFCIARDNFPERLFFSNQKTIHTTTSFNRAVKRKQQYTWAPPLAPPTEVFESTSPYKSPVPVWVFNNMTGSIKTLEIPLTSGTVSCKSSRTVRYLEEFKSQCLHPTVSKNECEDPQSMLNGQLFCENVVLISSPILVNQTRIEESPEEAFLTLRTVVCEKNGSNCEEVKNITVPAFDSGSNSCINGVISVQYIIYHNSSNGIVDAECQLVYGTVLSNKPFSQHVNVVFKWAKNETGAFPRSGMPGYLQGKPLISGNLLAAMADSVKRETVNMSSISEEWLTLPTANKEGLCFGKRNVLFKENLRTQCDIRVSREALLNQEGCSKLKEEIWTIIFGNMKVNKSDTRQLLSLISAFGDPAPDAPDDWVPIFLDRSLDDQQVKAPCPTQISGVQYRVLYSYFGPFSNPQMKIIGLFATVNTKDVECKVNGCNIRIVSSVNFLDVSQQAVNKFAKAPVVKIRLPPDFFYPFSSRCSKGTSDITVVFISYVLLLLGKRLD